MQVITRTAFIKDLTESSRYVVSVRGQIKREEIGKVFAGNEISDTFGTGMYCFLALYHSGKLSIARLT